jgi:uncharacterized protein
MIIQIVKNVMVLMLLTLSHSIASAASFECEKARTNVEKIICSSQKISRQDVELSQVYASALKNEESTRETRNAQVRWLKERNECRGAECVKRAYEKRISVLAHLTSGHNVLLAREWQCEAEVEASLRKVCEEARDAKPGKYEVKLVWSDERAQVCGVMLKNMMTYAEPMSCGLSFSSGYQKHFGCPEWERLNPWESLDLLWQADIQGTVLNPNRESLQKLTRDEWLRQFKQMLVEENITPILLQGNFDLNGDGKIDYVIAYGFLKNQPCNPWRLVMLRGYKFFVVDDVPHRLVPQSFTGHEELFSTIHWVLETMGDHFDFESTGWGYGGFLF